MPELPELQALVEALDPLVSRSPLDGAPICHFAVLKTALPRPEELAGRTFTGARRRAKRLLFETTDGGPVLLVHLMTAGRMAFAEPGEKSVGSEVLTVRFADEGKLLVGERARRKSVRVWILTPQDLEAELAGLGPEPLDGAFDLAALRAVLTRGGQLHSLLRDQHAIAGIGRAYANEILHAAQLSPFAPADRLDDDAVARLHAAIRETLLDGIERFRAHGVRMAQSKKSIVGLYDVHGHAGDPCPRCREELRSVDFVEHQIVYCPHCQTGGKVYADRRMSRLLR
jgi:formamidopyrimidine-DNA glycosylase